MHITKKIYSNFAIKELQMIANKSREVRACRKVLDNVPDSCPEWIIVKTGAGRRPGTLSSASGSETPDLSNSASFLAFNFIKPCPSWAKASMAKSSGTDFSAEIAIDQSKAFCCVRRCCLVVSITTMIISIHPKKASIPTGEIRSPTVPPVIIIHPIDEIIEYELSFVIYRAADNNRSATKTAIPNSSRMKEPTVITINSGDISITL
ncbi:MAG TPA: hypothetical protein VIH42_13100 [Thermoguttaceae bacterium]